MTSTIRTRWRVNGSADWPASLTIGGVEYSLPADAIYEILRDAPRIAGRWESREDDMIGTGWKATMTREQVFPPPAEDGEPPVMVFQRKHGERFHWECDAFQRDLKGGADTLEAAKAAADEALRSEGWVLL